ncbi:conserved membrane hypothetical protein [Thiomonas sp. X19]|uniref:BPSS1780 family membrane protein n=1 Tax=Thiomonas sp. X19 TaxID=1050370 RepID=UPI000B65B538|nr:BPSS1780 family membrane protein [Thiomonas sp. X19]SCC93279.1 conserved membrane hypothetical protein [Thiomonas sp. X19]
MQLRTVPAREGLSWVKLGFVWLFRQPWSAMMMMGSYILVVGLFSMLPVLGGLVPLLVVQIATVGFLLASRKIARGEAVWPTVLLTGLRESRSRVRALLALGVLYAAAVVGVLAVASLMDGGALLRLLLFGAMPAQALVKSGVLRDAALLATLSYIPVSMAFWFAPPLVSWHGMGPWQALFTSFVICLRNVRAFMLYSMQWFLLFATIPLLVVTLAQVVGASAEVATLLSFPVALMLFLAFILSFYGSVQSLLPDSEPSPVALRGRPPQAPH